MKALLSSLLLLSSLFVCSVTGHAQSSPTWREWNQPVEPYKIVGNIYYVGTKEIASYLITSPTGHILIDGGFVESAPIIRDNIGKLGFKLSDVKVLLNSHAHADHAGGLAQLKTWTGAQFVASAADAPLLARGGREDFAWGDKLTFPEVKADRMIGDRETVKEGGTVMTAHLTPGHTKGCTTWTTTAEENGRKYNVVFVCSVSAPGYKLVNNASYPNIVEDYEHTFAYLKSLPCDVPLGSHAGFFHLNEKAETAKQKPVANPFVNSQEYREFLDEAQRDFEAEVAKQKGSKDPG